MPREYDFWVYIITMAASPPLSGCNVTLPLDMTKIACRTYVPLPKSTVSSTVSATATWTS